MPQVSKPTGFFGRLLARGMALGHRGFYNNTARILELKNDDKYLEIGFAAVRTTKPDDRFISLAYSLSYAALLSFFSLFVKNFCHLC
jgi:hypothetical protein